MKQLRCRFDAFKFSKPYWFYTSMIDCQSCQWSDMMTPWHYHSPFVPFLFFHSHDQQAYCQITLGTRCCGSLDHSPSRVILPKPEPGFVLPCLVEYGVIVKMRGSISPFGPHRRFAVGTAECRHAAGSKRGASGEVHRWPWLIHIVERSMRTRNICILEMFVDVKTHRVSR